MTRLSHTVYLLVLGLAALPLAGGCGGSSDEDVNAPKVTGGLEGLPSPGGAGPMGGGPGGPGGPGGGQSSPAIKAIMVKLNKAPSGLQMVLDTELKAEKPAWETIQPQTKEYAQLAGDLVKLEPTRGSKESWAKLAAAYAEAATELDKAAQAKDKDATVEAHTELANSCMSCHRQHRGGPGMGGMGGMPKGGPRGAGQQNFGPPPGGGGPPPGGGSPPPSRPAAKPN